MAVPVRVVVAAAEAVLVHAVVPELLRAWEHRGVAVVAVVAAVVRAVVAVPVRVVVAAAEAVFVDPVVPELRGAEVGVGVAVVAVVPAEVPRQIAVAVLVVVRAATAVRVHTVIGHVGRERVEERVRVQAVASELGVAVRVRVAEPEHLVDRAVAVVVDGVGRVLDRARVNRRVAVVAVGAADVDAHPAVAVLIARAPAPAVAVDAVVGGVRGTAVHGRIAVVAVALRLGEPVTVRVDGVERLVDVAVAVVVHAIVRELEARRRAGVRGVVAVHPAKVHAVKAVPVRVIVEGAVAVGVDAVVGDLALRAWEGVREVVAAVVAAVLGA